MTSCGKHALEHLPLELTAVGAKKPLVVTNRSISALKGTTHLINAFKESGITVGIVDSVNSSSGIDTVKELALLYQDKGFDAIIALGGSSPANLSKVLNLALSQTHGNLKTLAGRNKINRPLNSMFYIPAGTGSGFETAGEALVETLEFSSMFLMPDKVIIDPRLMAADSVSALAAQAMASLACCVEAHYTTKDPLVRAYASTGITLVMENIKPALKPLFAGGKPGGFFSRLPYGKSGRKPGHQNELAALATAAAFSGYIWSNCPELITVRLGRTLGRFCSTLPGLLMGALLPTVIDYFAIKRSPARSDAVGRLLLPLAGVDIFCATPEGQRSDLAPALIRQLTNRLFLDSRGVVPRTLGDADISFGTLEKLLAQWSPKEDFGPGNEALRIILEHAHAGEPVKQGENHVFA
jgi:alcohol dehydrogenase